MKKIILIYSLFFSFQIGFSQTSEEYFLKGYNESCKANPNYNIVIDYYNKAIELNPRNAGAYDNRGGAKYILGNYQEAVSDYNKAIELNPRNAATYYNRGGAKYDLGNYQEAIYDCNKAIELNPNFSDAKEMLKIAKSKLEEQARQDEYQREYQNRVRMEELEKSKNKEIITITVLAIFVLIVLILLYRKKKDKSIPVVSQNDNYHNSEPIKQSIPTMTKVSIPVPEVCPHCKSPNTKKLQVCDWCGSELV
ncbi:MAG: tetratricopeptide repeat protein [Candidatus Kapabacteria bacterium]|nr:tetratricopeptide repeat protein [Candidatus Kapabacteria bacterium]